MCAGGAAKKVTKSAGIHHDNAEFVRVAAGCSCNTLQHNKPARKINVQFQHLLAASRFLSPASPFACPADEKSFQTDYRTGGYGFTVAVILKTVVAGSVFAVMVIDLVC